MGFRSVFDGVDAVAEVCPGYSQWRYRNVGFGKRGHLPYGLLPQSVVVLMAPLGRISSVCPVSETSTLISSYFRTFRFTLAGSSTNLCSNGGPPTLSTGPPAKAPAMSPFGRVNSITRIATDASAGRMTRSVRARRAQPAPIAAVGPARSESRSVVASSSNIPSLDHDITSMGQPVTRRRTVIVAVVPLNPPPLWVTTFTGCSRS